MAPLGAFLFSRFRLFVLFFQRANAVNDLQVVVLGEVEHEAVGHWFNFAEATVDEDGFFAVVVSRANVGGVFHLALGAEG